MKINTNVSSGHEKLGKLGKRSFAESNLKKLEKGVILGFPGLKKIEHFSLASAH